MLNIKKELLVFFCACLTGVNVRAGYEILIFLRKMIIHNNLVKGIEDLLKLLEKTDRMLIIGKFIGGLRQ